MTHVLVHPDLSRLSTPASDHVSVHLYGAKAEPGMAAIGGPILDVVSRVGNPVDATAFDFLSLSLAVTAADTFTNRRDAADGWARNIHLTVALANPEKWSTSIPILENALGFLSGDQWTLELLDGGKVKPTPRPRVRNKLLFDGYQSACLYSGGLDSAIGLLNARANGDRTVLVSHAYPHDSRRQKEILSRVPEAIPRLALHANPRQQLSYPNDVQMRTRSFNFLAMGTLAAATLGHQFPDRTRVPLVIPENGLIAINPPLTGRRIGALSTRTTHPYYLGLIQSVLDKVGLPVALTNPFAFKTKGEMIEECLDQEQLASIAGRTVSCGKWKRSGQQCGKCVPCLIRRASFYAAGWEDPTHYKMPGADLHQFFSSHEDTDDLMAMILACRRHEDEDIEAWVAKTGSLPSDSSTRLALVGVVRRGMTEMSRFLESQDLLR